MEIKIFARGPNQEYSSDPGQPGNHVYKWSKVPARLSEKSDGPLRNFVKVRKEPEGFGFVHNLQNNLILYADAQALAIIEAGLDRSLSSLRTTDSWLVNSLCLSTS
jgi:hypothetical protein